MAVSLGDSQPCQAHSLYSPSLASGQFLRTFQGCWQAWALSTSASSILSKKAVATVLTLTARSPGVCHPLGSSSVQGPLSCCHRSFTCFFPPTFLFLFFSILTLSCSSG